MKQVMITGISSGIGFGLASEFLRQGAEVTGISRRQPSDLLQHKSFRYAQGDLRVESEVDNAVSQLLQPQSQLDLIVLNAGVLGEFGDLADASMQDLLNTMSINVWANKWVMDAIRRLDGSVRQIVAISSGASVNGNRGWSGYSISKAALNMMMKLYSEELPETHITSLAPGLVDTAMQDQLCGRQPDDRFPALEFLRGKRNTEEMPDAEAAAQMLCRVITQLPNQVKSGEYVDVRNLSFELEA